MIGGDNRLLTSHSWEDISAERHGKLFSSLPPGAENLYIHVYYKKSKRKKISVFQHTPGIDLLSQCLFDTAIC